VTAELDKIEYVISGHGYSMHWEVKPEIAENYHARDAKQPARHEFTAGDYVCSKEHGPQHFNGSNEEPLMLVTAQTD